MTNVAQLSRENHEFTDIKAQALKYIEASGKGQLDVVAELLSPSLDFRLGDKTSDKQSYLLVLKRLGLIWRGSEVKKVFVDGNDVAVFYDIITDTPVGAVPSVEWLTFEGPQIRSIRLIFERERWPEVQAEMQRRAAAAA